MNLQSVSVKKGLRESLFLIFASLSAVLAAAVISAAPIYFDAIERLGIQRMTDGFSPAQKGAWIKATDVTFNPAAVSATRDSLARAGDELGEIVRARAIFLRSGALRVSAIEDSPPPPTLEFHYQSVEGLEPDITLSEGAFPSANAGDIEVAILSSAALELGINVGESLTLTAPPTTIVHSVARVVGTFEISDPDDESWLGLSSSIFDPQQGATGGRPPIIALAHQASLDRITRRGIADTGEIWALYYSDAESLERIDIESALAYMNEFRKAVSRDLAGAIAFSGLQSAYLTLQRQITFANTITIITGSLFAVFALFNLAIHAHLVSSKWSDEEIMLQVRGANRNQILRVVSIYALLLFALPAALGPLIASTVLPFLGTLTALSELTDGRFLQFRLEPQQFIWAAVASLASLALFLSPILKTRSSQLVRRLARTRNSDTPWFWRANIDLGVIIAAAAVIFELNGRGTLFISREDGSIALSILAASVPIVAALVIALLSLRLLVAAAPLIERISRINLSPMASFGMTLLSRSAVQHAVLMLLAVGVTIVAITGLGLASVLQQNARERISFQTPLDMRISGLDGVDGANNPEVLGVLSKQWADEFSWGARTKATAGTTEASGQFELLALQPHAFGQNAWFRSDFSSERLQSLMESIEAFEAPRELTLPPSTTGLRASAKLDRSGSGRMDLWARVIDGQGSTHTIRLAPENEDDTARWQTWHGSFKEPLPQPLGLIAIQVYQPPTAPLGNVAELTIDYISALSPDGYEAVISEFDGTHIWHAMEASLPDNASLVNLPSQHAETSDGIALRVSMGKGNDNGIRGIYHSTEPATVVPVAVSEGFRKETGFEVGDSFTGRAFGQLVPFEINAEFDLFPTMHHADSPFAVANIDALLAYITPVSEPFLGNNAELFLNIVGESSPDQRLNDIKSINPSFRVLDREQLISESSTSFAATTGWRVIGIAISISALAIASTSAVAFTLHREQTFNLDRAVLETLGAGKWAIAFGSFLRTCATLATGIAFGLLSGLIGIRFVAERMTRAETGENVLPPMQLAMDWTSIALITTAFSIAAFAPILLTVLFNRESIAARMRSAAAR